MFRVTVAMILGLGFTSSLVGTFLHFTSYTPTQSQIASVTSITNEVAHSNLPVRIKIPKINVDTHVGYVGVRDGKMDIPKNAEDVAWFDQGALPGDVGSAVIDGHSSWRDGLHAVFDNLGELRPGDKIYVENDTGVTVTFIVTHLERYNPEADASLVFESFDGKAHLNLVTCEGFWDTATKTSSSRLVVFTEKITE